MRKQLEVAELNTLERYVAIGDSFSEGMMDPYPNGTFRGWTDRLAGKLSAVREQHGLEPTLYANLAVRGKLLQQILDEQLDRALELRPTLISIVGGGNDLLRPKSNPDQLAELFERVIARATAEGVRVLTSTSSNSAGSGLVSLTRGAGGIYNTHICSIAARYGASVIDQWGLQALRTWPAWAADRIHLTPTGHEIVARAAMVALGLGEQLDYSQHEPVGDEVEIPLDVPNWQAVPKGWEQVQPTRAEDIRWLKEDVGPWVMRRVQRRSSGDNVDPKRPQLVPAQPRI